MNRIHLAALVIFLNIVGWGLFLYKVLVLHFPLAPDTKSSLWNVEARVQFTPSDKSVKISLYIPQTSKRSAVLDEGFISRGFGLTTSSESGSRKAVWSIRETKGQQSLYYRAVVRQLNTQQALTTSKLPTINNPGFEASYFLAADSIISEIKEHSADTDSFVKALIKLINRSTIDDRVQLLLGKDLTVINKSRVASKVLAQANIPSRMVSGIKLEDQRSDCPLIHWLEVYIEGKWQPYDTVSGQAKIPDDYLVWYRGDFPILEAIGADKHKVTLSISRDEESAISTALIQGQIRNPKLLEFSLFSVPLATQSIFKVLLLVPVGAAVLALLRNVVGIKTFGTFMPVLVALAFRETKLAWGIILFTLLISLGLAFRFYFGKLKLLLVPRLASVLIVVVILMAVLTIVINKLGLDLGLSLSLFPMVIMTMTIERICIVWEESGPAEAIKQAIWSLAAASLTYLIITHETLSHLVFVFPELLLVLLSMTLLLGRYSGYRLLELHRFKSLLNKKQ